VAICELCGWVLTAEHYVYALGDYAEVDYGALLGRCREGAAGGRDAELTRRLDRERVEAGLCRRVLTPR